MSVINVSGNDKQVVTDTSLTLNLAKCDFEEASVTFLSTMEDHRLKVSVEAKVDATAELPVKVSN